MGHLMIFSRQFPAGVTVKELRKSVNICRRYAKGVFGVYYFKLTITITLVS